MNTPIIEQLLEQLKSLPQELQWRVLEFTRALALSTPPGVPGPQLIQFAGFISPAELDLMQQAIDEGCGQIDDEW